MLPPADPKTDEKGKERNAEEADGRGREDADVGRRGGGGVVRELDDISELT